MAGRWGQGKRKERDSYLAVAVLPHGIQAPTDLTIVRVNFDSQNLHLKTFASCNTGLGFPKSRGDLARHVMLSARTSQPVLCQEENSPNPILSLLSRDPRVCCPAPTHTSKKEGHLPAPAASHPKACRSPECRSSHRSAGEWRLRVALVEDFSQETQGTASTWLEAGRTLDSNHCTWQAFHFCTFLEGLDTESAGLRWRRHRLTRSPRPSVSVLPEPKVRSPCLVVDEGCWGTCPLICILEGRKEHRGKHKPALASSVCAFQKQVNMKLPCEAAILFLGLSPKEIQAETQTLAQPLPRPGCT
ncbi:uncharacterized protein LOC108582114 [Papio anubis]|uniref:uncharacterized protein LOC108582114 n=1 Tax=Papio anubis TaxID=9555 RepID=UPI0012AD45E3|nr:uncharacterized protein LOC108582114 [Papio anubis]